MISYPAKSYAIRSKKILLSCPRNAIPGVRQTSKACAVVNDASTRADPVPAWSESATNGEGVMRRANLLSVLALVGFLGGGALAKDVRSWDIVGMRLGMSIGEIEAAAVARGLLEKGRSKAPSFEQAVLIRKGHRIKGIDYNGVKMLKFASDTEVAEVNFVATPEGPRAYIIHYVNTDSDLSSEAMSAEVERKYGPPDQRSEQTWVWGDLQPIGLRTAPSLEYDIRPLSVATDKKPKGALTLQDPELRKAAIAAIDAAGS